MADDTKHVAQQFTAASNAITSVQPIGNGNINATFLITLSHTAPPFILQRINTHVFRDPKLVMQNMHTVCRHINARAAHSPSDSGRKWLMPEILHTTQGTDHVIDQDGNFWRAMTCIESAQTFETIHSPSQAWEIGWALGRFHNLTHDLDPFTLADTLPGFHHTPTYLRTYQQALRTFSGPQSPDLDFCLTFIDQHQGMAPILEEAKQAGKLKERTIHGDPKVSNIMVDVHSGMAVSIIDLDTVKPGLIHYDLGDCLRSACNPAGETAPSPEAISFDLDLCREILSGYFSQTQSFLTPFDFDMIYSAVRLIAFELGIRYCTDYLLGNRYFKTPFPEQNLQRALVQFYLARNIEAKEKQITSLINSLRH